jgi:hypothetical protein
MIRYLKIAVAAPDPVGNRDVIVRDLVVGATRLKEALAELPVVDSNKWELHHTSFSGRSETIHYEAETHVDCDDKAMTVLVRALLDQIKGVVSLIITETLC